MVEEKFKICSELWSVGVKAEIVYHDNPKPTKQMETALERGIPLVMFIGGDELTKGIVKIRILNEDREIEISRREMVERVSELISQNPFLKPQE